MKVDMDGRFEVSTPPADTFQFLTSPDRFAPVLPYFKELHRGEAESFIVVLEVGVPQIRGRAEVNTRRIEAVDAERVVYQISGRHTLGMIDATMTFSITATTLGGSRVDWISDGTVSGTLASLAQGLLLPLARRQIKSLVLSVQKELGAASQDAAVESVRPTRSIPSIRGLFGAKAHPVSGGSTP